MKFYVFQILRSLSKVLNEKDPAVDTFCIGNTTRPLFSYGPRGSKGSRRTYLYVEALKRFKVEAMEMNLDEAYKRARPIYEGRLEHTFIVLKENHIEDKGTGANQEPIGNKRRSSMMDVGTIKKKAK